MKIFWRNDKNMFYMKLKSKKSGMVCLVPHKQEPILFLNLIPLKNQK